MTATEMDKILDDAFRTVFGDQWYAVGDQW
jgi:hypothetical protein